MQRYDLSPILEPLAKGENLERVLGLICEMIEREHARENVRASVILLDAHTGTLQLAAGPSRPPGYADAVAVLKPGPAAGSCGTAIHRAQRVIVEDTATDPLWADARDFAIRWGIRACWSQPILGTDGAVLGSFALHYPEPRRPTAADLEAISQLSWLAGVAIERAHAQAETRARSNLLNLIVENVNQGVAIFDRNRRLVHFNQHYQRLYNLPDGLIAVGRTYDEIVRYLVERGAYGPVDPDAFIARRLKELETRREWRNLRHREDGTSIAVYRRRLDDGGIIITFTDITAEVRATFETQRNAQLLAATLDNANIGIRVLDGNGKLALWNMRYREMIRLPDHLMRVGTPYEDILRYTLSRHVHDPQELAARIERRMRQFRERAAASEIRQAHDGRILHQTRQSMPDGGMVSTYTDMTQLRQAEMALDRNTKLLQTSLENISQGLLLFDRDMRLTLFNKSWLRLFGFAEDQIRLGMHYREILRALVDRGEYGTADGAALIENRLASAASGHVHRNLHRMHDGSIVSVYRKPVPDGGFVITFTDVTNEVRAGEEAKVKSALLQATQDNMSQGICVMDEKLVITNFNRRWAEIFDIPLDILRPGVTLSAVLAFRATRGDFGPGDIDELVRARLERVQSDQTYRSERILPNGTAIALRRSPMPGGGFVTTYTDVTERWKAEREAAEKSRLLEAALASMSQGICIHDKDLKIVAYNEKYLAARGDLPHEFVRAGANHEDTIRFRAQRGDYGPGDVEEHVRARMQKMKDGGIHSPVRLVRGRVIQAQREPMPDGGYVTTYTDITDLKKVEAELTRARDSAEAANRAKTEFLANMSHELRTPLNAIIGFSEMMANGIYGPLGDPRYGEYATSINESGMHLLSLIDDILDLSKIEVGKMTLHEEVVLMPPLIESCLVLVGDAARSNGVSLYSTMPGALPGVRADGRKIKQIVLNLLQNAIKFTPDGGLVKTTAALEADGRFRIDVMDTGIGMRPEDIPLALERFAQVEGSLSRRYNGAGLGLPLAKSLAELHGGTLSIESAPGQGTHVTIHLPADRVLPREAESLNAQASA